MADATTGASPQRERKDVAARGGNGRWWAAVVVGCVLSVPFAWILSYVAALPFFIGVFFFALLGLVIGAVMHRVAAPGRPYARTPLLIGTTIVVLLCWGLTVVKEARDLPTDLADGAVGFTFDLGGRTTSEFRADVAADVRAHLREAYPPGGTIGYVRWVLTDGVIKKGLIEDVNRPLERPQRGATWLIRVALSIGLLAFGIGSQTLALRLVRDPAVRVSDVHKDDRG